MTIPSQVQHRLEILHEARYYRLDGLASIIASPAQYQQPHPYVTQQITAQALAANAAAQMQAQAQAQVRVQTDQEKPSFMTVRPSTRGLFYLCDSKWSVLFPEKPSWNIIAVNFEDASDEVVFWSISVSFQQDPTTGHIIPTLSSRQELCRTKLEVGMSAKVCPSSGCTTDSSSALLISPTSTPKILISLWLVKENFGGSLLKVSILNYMADSGEANLRTKLVRLTSCALNLNN